MFVVDVITDASEHATNIFDNLKTAQRRFRNPARAITRTITTLWALLPDSDYSIRRATEIYLFTRTARITKLWRFIMRHWDFSQLLNTIL